MLCVVWFVVWMFIGVSVSLLLLTDSSTSLILGRFQMMNCYPSFLEWMPPVVFLECSGSIYIICSGLWGGYGM